MFKLLIGLTAICLCVALIAWQRHVGANEANDNEDDLRQVAWWKKGNFYHIYVRSFRDSDGDGQGDLGGVLEKLDYLQSIGVETLLMSPFYQSPMKDGGYDVSNYLDVNPMFGTLNDFDRLLAGLKQRAMRIVLDFIPNHTSNQHAWFKCSELAYLNPKECSKFKDYYVWSNSTRFQGKYPSNWLSQFGDKSAWQWSKVRQEFYYHQFLAEQPDLNLRSQLVQEELKEVLKFWLNKGVDGFRVDAVLYMYENEALLDEPVIEPLNPEKTSDYDKLNHIYTMSLYDSAKQIKIWHDLANQFGKDKVIITEAYDTIPKTLEYYGPNPNERFADMPFDFQLFKLTADNYKPEVLEELLSSWLKATKSLNWPLLNGAFDPWSCWVTGNHDNSRLANRLGLINLDFYKWVSYFALGSPVDYYGDEIGLMNANYSDIPEKTIKEAGEWSRLAYRVPMAWTPTGGFSESSSPWMPLNQNFKTVNVETLLEGSGNEQSNHLKKFIKLLKLKRDYLKTFVFGDLVIYPNQATHVFAMSRIYERRGKTGENLLLLSNFNQKEESIVNLKPRKTLLKDLNSEPPKSGLIELVNYESAVLRLGLEVDLKNLILGPSQSVILRY